MDRFEVEMHTYIHTCLVGWTDVSLLFTYVLLLLVHGFLSKDCPNNFLVLSIHSTYYTWWSEKSNQPSLSLSSASYVVVPFPPLQASFFQTSAPLTFTCHLPCSHHALVPHVHMINTFMTISVWLVHSWPSTASKSIFTLLHISHPHWHIQINNKLTTVHEPVLLIKKSSKLLHHHHGTLH